MSGIRTEDKHQPTELIENPGFLKEISSPRLISRKEDLLVKLVVIFHER